MITIKSFHLQYLTVFSIVTSTFTENREKFLGYGEMAAGTGLLVGPIVGGWIYS